VAYKKTRVGITNISRGSRTVTGLVKDFGGADADEVQVLNGLVALGYDPNLIRGFSDADPNRRFLGDAVTRALRAGVTEDDVRKALAYNKVAVEDHSSLRGLNLAKALGLDVGKVSAEANRLKGPRHDPTPDQWAQAAIIAGGLNPEAANSFTRYVRSEPADFVGKGQPTGAPPGAAPPPATAGWVSHEGLARQAPAEPTGPLQQPKPGQPGGPLGTRGTLAGTTTTQPQQTPGIKALPTLSPNASDAEVEKYIRKWYGYSAWILDIPELRGKMLELGREFAGSDVDEARIEGALTGTEWWKTHEADQRLAIEEKLSDPATYNANVERTYRTLAQLTGTSGFTIGEGRLRQIAITAYDGGWNQAEMQAAVAAEFDYNPDTGAQADTRLVGDLQQLASDYLVPLGEQTIDQWGRQIIAGTSTNEDFTQYAKNMAKGMFGHYAADIDAGRTVKQIADPFVQIAARDLELTADQIDLMDPKWRKALEMDPETGQPMQLSKWQRTIRSDSSYGWDTTQNARGEAAEFAKKIAEAFGR
jgi:hypothetical protein